MLLDSTGAIDVDAIKHNKADFGRLPGLIDAVSVLLPGNINVVGLRLSGKLLAGQDAVRAVNNLLEHKGLIKRSRTLRHQEIVLMTSNSLKNRFQLIDLAQDTIQEVTDVEYERRADYLNFAYVDIKTALGVPSMGSRARLTAGDLDRLIVL